MMLTATAITDPNKARHPSQNGKIKNAITNGSSQTKKPNPEAPGSNFIARPSLLLRSTNSTGL